MYYCANIWYDNVYLHSTFPHHERERKRKESGQYLCLECIIYRNLLCNLGEQSRSVPCNWWQILMMIVGGGLQQNSFQSGRIFEKWSQRYQSDWCHFTTGHGPKVEKAQTCYATCQGWASSGWLHQQPGRLWFDCCVTSCLLPVLHSLGSAHFLS